MGVARSGQSEDDRRVTVWTSFSTLMKTTAKKPGFILRINFIMGYNHALS